MTDSVQCAIAGSLAGAPEIRRERDGGTVVGFRLATAASGGDPGDGGGSALIDVSIRHAALGELARSTLSEGSRVLVQGVLRDGACRDDARQGRSAAPEIVLNRINSALVILDTEHGTKTPDD